MKKLLAINDLTCIFRGTQGQIEKSARARVEAHICPARRSYIRRHTHIYAFLIHYKCIRSVVGVTETYNYNPYNYRL